MEGGRGECTQGESSGGEKEREPVKGEPVDGGMNSRQNKFKAETHKLK